MVHQLCASLNLPLRESNALFEAAGYAPPFGDTPFSAEEQAIANQAIGLVLANQEPHPAVVIDRHWNLLQANQGAQRFFATLLDGAPTPPPQNVIRLMFHEDWLKPWVLNWPSVAAALLKRVHREAICGVVDQQTSKLLAEVMDYPGVREGVRSAPVNAPDFSPILAIEFIKGDLHARYFSTVTTLGTPQEIALQELRIECFFPAEDLRTVSVRDN